MASEAREVCSKICPDKFQGCFIRQDFEAGIIQVPGCIKEHLFLPEQRPPEAQKDEKSLTPHGDGRNKIKNSSQNLTFRQPNSSMGREERRKCREELKLKILKLITLMYPVSSIARILKQPRTTILYWVNKFEKRGLVKPDGKSNTRSNPKFYKLTTAGTKVLIHNEGSSSAYDPPFNYTHHAVSFKSEYLGGTHPKGDHSYHPKNWQGEVFYRDGYKIRLTPKHAIVDIHEDLSADTESNLLLKYHTLAQNYLRQFSAQYNIQLSPIVEQNREPHRAIPGSHSLAQKILGSMGGELHDKETGLQVDESDKNHKGEIEFIGKEGAETSERFLHLVNQGPTILATTRAKVDENNQRINSFEKVLCSDLQELKMEMREIKTEIKEIPLAIKLQQTEQENEELRARLQERESQAPENAGKFERQPKERESMYG
ncbi:MAG: hypothetical protein PHU34_09325 [Candidatus Methanoperedens sp.]|nr:hypothetical protein [Candidatus Methanoperedens sp.]